MSHSQDNTANPVAAGQGMDPDSGPERDVVPDPLPPERLGEVLHHDLDPQDAPPLVVKAALTTGEYANEPRLTQQD